jgi:hypothetical protein
LATEIFWEDFMGSSSISETVDYNKPTTNGSSPSMVMGVTSKLTILYAFSFYHDSFQCLFYNRLFGLMAL